MKGIGAFVKTFGLLWIIVLCFAFLIDILAWILFRYSFGVSFLITLVISILIAIVIMIVMMAKENKSPISNLTKEMRLEIRANGYSDKVLEIAEEGIKLCSASSHDFVYLKDFAIYGAECYMYKQNCDKALQLLNLIDINEILNNQVIELTKRRIAEGK